MSSVPPRTDTPYMKRPPVVWIELSVFYFKVGVPLRYRAPKGYINTRILQTMISSFPLSYGAFNYTMQYYTILEYTISLYTILFTILGPYVYVVFRAPYGTPWLAGAVWDTPKTMTELSGPPLLQELWLISIVEAIRD